MRDRLLRLVLRLHPRRFRELLAAEVREHFRRLDGQEQRRMLCDLSRQLPGVHLDQLRLARAARPGFARRPEAPMLDLLARDCHFAARRLSRAPLVTTVAALTLALGIGGTTAIFSLINGVYLEPFSTPHADRLVHVHELNADANRLALSYESFVDYRREAESFEQLAVIRAQSVNVNGGGEDPERIRGLFVSASFFAALGESPILGRALREGEDRPGGDYATVLSHGFWQRRFGGDRAVIGQTVKLNNIEHAIVGVMGPDFRFPYDRTEAWISLQTYPGSLDRGNRTLFTFGLMRDGVTVSQARGEMAALAGGLAEAFPQSHREVTAGARPLTDAFTGPRTRSLFQILLAAVATVLLIGTANVANLQLAQATGRLREMAVRTAVGASRRRLVAQLLIENLLLALVGGTLGVGVAYGGVWLLSEHGPGWINGLYSIEPDVRVLAFSLLVSLLTGILFGLAPARRAAAGDLTLGLKDGGRGAGLGKSGGRLRSALVIAQSALAVMLVIGTALLMRSFLNLQRIDVGFDNDNLMTVQFRLPANKYEADEKVVSFFQQLIEKVEALPGVEAAATAMGMPFTGDEPRVPLLADGVDPGLDVQVPNLRANSVSLGYFSTMGIPLLAGRSFERGDSADSLPVAVLSLEAAARLWPEEDGEQAVGRTLRIRGETTDLTVVGIVGDIYNRGLRSGVDPMLYLVHAQEPQRFATLAARVQGEASSYGPALRQAIWDLDPEQPVWEMMTQDQRIAGWLGSERFVTSLLGVFAITALLLAAIGIGGVIAYVVALRRRELGIRLSLGASQRRIMLLVIGQGLGLVGLGLLIGLAGAALLQRALAGFLFGVEALDPFSFALAPTLLLGVALLATLAPAWRAAWLDPVRTLRED